MENEDVDRGSALIFLGFLVTDDVERWISARSSVLATQTHKFGWSLVRALKSQNWRIEALSSLPTPDYPKFPKILMTAGSFQQSGVRGRYLPSINLIVLKHISRFFASIAEIPRAVKRSESSIVLVHGAHSPYLAAALALRRLCNLDVFAVVTDPPALLLMSDSPLRRSLKRVDQAIVRWLLGRTAGVVVVAEPIAKDFARGVPHLVVPGFSTERATASRTHANDGPMRFAYAGGLSEEYGVDALVEAFYRAAEKDAELHLYGSGPLEPWIRSKAAAVPGLIFHGYLANDDLMQLLSAMDVLINPRPLDGFFVKYSFPSKVLEYMSLGVPLMSTDMPGFDVEFQKYYTSCGDGTIGELEAALKSARSNIREMRERAESGQVWVNAEYSSSSTGERIATFLRQNATARRGSNT